MDIHYSQSAYSQTKQQTKTFVDFIANFISLYIFRSSTQEQRATERTWQGEQADTKRSAHLKQF